MLLCLLLLFLPSQHALMRGMLLLSDCAPVCTAADNNQAAELYAAQ
jgi:hypothetical protein